MITSDFDIIDDYVKLDIETDIKSIQLDEFIGKQQSYKINKVEHKFVEMPIFGNTSVCKLKCNGSFVQNPVLKIVLPKLNSGYYNLDFVDKIIKNAELTIDEKVVDSTIGRINQNIAYINGKNYDYWKSLKQVDTSYASQRGLTICIPLMFDCMLENNAIPINKIKTDVIIKITFESVHKLIENISKVTAPNIIEAVILVDYIIFDDVLLSNYNSLHSYNFKTRQIQYMTSPVDDLSGLYKLNFKGIFDNLVLFFTLEDNVTLIKGALISATLQIDNNNYYVDNGINMRFNNWDKFKIHYPDDPYYVINLSKDPRELSSAAITAAESKNIQLNLILSTKHLSPLILHCFTRSYNIVEIRQNNECQFNLIV
jgi:hypothetical protein